MILIYLVFLLTIPITFGVPALGPDFPTGHTNANIAWMTLITSPVQTYIQSTPFGNKTFLYQTTQDYSKTLATNPTTPCSIASPCSLRDYLWQKYGGNIANLNKAWGANYTTFDSTGMQVTDETVGTGDGTTISLHPHLGPCTSVSIQRPHLIKGTAQMGDCPWFHRAVARQRRTRALLAARPPI